MLCVLVVELEKSIVLTCLKLFMWRFFFFSFTVIFQYLFLHVKLNTYYYETKLRILCRERLCTTIIFYMCCKNWLNAMVIQFYFRIKDMQSLKLSNA